MKKIKKLLALALAGTMVFAMAVPTFAASDYTITVENSIGGSTYSAYKVFDVTGSGDAVSYTIDSSSAWYAAVNASSLFTLTQGSGTTYYVTANGSDAEIIAFLNSTYETISSSLTAAATESGNGGALTLDVNESGYYYVTTSQGATASITTAAPSVTIVDKNQSPGTGGTDPGPDPDPNWGGFSKDAEGSSYSVGDHVSYTIKTYVPTYDGENEVSSYTITDTMGAGLTYDTGTIKVQITGTGLTTAEDITSFCTVNYDSATHVLTVIWDPRVVEAAIEYIYPSDAVATITYTDTVNEAADDADLTNVVGLKWTSITPTGDTEDGEYDPDDDPKTQVYTYGFDLKKTDGTNTLTGAQFTLADSAGALITFLYDASSDTYEVWDGTTQGTTTTTITVSDGELNIWGLGAGTYTLTETVAPDGYNPLTGTVSITIAAAENGWTVALSGAASGSSIGAFTDAMAQTDSHGVAIMPTITIVNNAGTILPGTGGMGTTLLYVIGIAIVAGAVIAVVVRRRRNYAN